MDNLLKRSNTNDLEDVKVIKLKSSESINEINLMSIPFVSFKKKKVTEIRRRWIKSDGSEVGITVVGTEKNGCPTMAEFDVLLALIKIMLEDQGNKYEYNKKDKKIKVNQRIYFTYKQLAKKLGYSDISGRIKNKLEKSIKILNEVTIYSDFALKDAESGDYVVDFKGEESSRILCSYKSYSMEKQKKKGEKFKGYKEIKESTSIMIDDFFYNNMCNNFFKKYDYNTYMSLKQGIAKKLFLILTQWSKGSEKYVSYKVLYDYIGLDVNTNEEKNYYNRRIKDSVQELKDIGFIQDFKIKKLQGVYFVFNQVKLDRKKHMNKYNNFDTIYNRLREIGFDLDDISKYIRLDNEKYVAALLRYTDVQIDKGNPIKDIKAYIEKGLKHENYDVREYESE